ncbi:hypothetical protein GBAR_LOCUS30232 [Geodia barretti]|uniref:Fibronectin type-III domain-containing protein n=1 Tax=Geodia barretti TaxID=519541 RepID=A0AA35XFC5_GEOBA|nr:hypothetical protein GBAR_LOCUS30232 [Geodia barretti]
MDSIETTPTTITLSWSLPRNVTGSEVSWELTEQTTRRRGVRNAEGGTSGRLPADQDSYTIDKLSSGTSYDITVTVFNPIGSSSTTFTRSTEGGVIDANQAESTSNTSAIIGGVVAVAVAFMIITSLTVIVVVILVLRSRSGNCSAKTRATVGATNQSVELSKLSEPTYADPDQLHTTRNEAYNVVRGTGRTVEDDYEVPQNLPPSTTSQQPTTTATGDYELV